MKFYETKKGQIIIAIITTVGALSASIFAAWATSNNRVAEIDKKISVIEERENNHYSSIEKRLDSIDQSLKEIANKK